MISLLLVLFISSCSRTNEQKYLKDFDYLDVYKRQGQENIYTFGKDSDTVIAHYANQDYVAKDIYEGSEHVKTLVDFLISDEMLRVGDPVSLTRLHHELIHKDWFMTLLDVEEYIVCKEKMLQDYEKQTDWGRKMLMNIAMSGFFSSDRTIQEYDRDIWKLS